jgi:hypothetical protein
MKMYESCENCAGSIATDLNPCSVCGFDKHLANGAVVVFQTPSREASDGLGGILAIHRVGGTNARFVARCVGGLLGIGRSGELLWRQDWMYVASLEVKGIYVIVNGREVDVDSGQPID